MTNQSFENLRGLFEARRATVAVVGQGYVGLPLALRFVEAGFHCIGVDINPQRVAQLRDGISHITDVTNEELSRALATGRYEPTDDFSTIARADAVSICVPTPLNKTREPDLSYIRSAAERIAPHLKSPSLVVLESTTYPGTTNEVLVPMLLSDQQHTLDEDVFVAFSPERVDPGNPTYKIGNTPKVVGGVSELSGQLVTALYEQVIDEVYPVASATGAELVKLLENTFRAVNIALVNEMAIMCDRMNIDIWSVIGAAATKPFGYMPFYPGPGIGGHCIPLDPSYLSWKAKSFGFYNRFIESATDINTNMPRFVVNKLARLLNERGQALRDANILLLGVSYKPDVSDTRESPALDIWALLTEWHARLSYHDPVVKVVEELGGERSIELTPQALQAADAVVVVTNHSAFDWDMIVEHAPLIFDTRNAIKQKANHIYKL